MLGLGLVWVSIRAPSDDYDYDYSRLPIWRVSLHPRVTPMPSSEAQCTVDQAPCTMNQSPEGGGD